jgi:hypothetical protein
MLGRVTEGGVPSSLCHFDAAAALRGLMPAGQDFEALHAAASAVLSSGGVEPESRVRLGKNPPAAACACQQAYCSLSASTCRAALRRVAMPHSRDCLSTDACWLPCPTVWLSSCLLSSYA